MVQNQSIDKIILLMDLYRASQPDNTYEFEDEEPLAKTTLSGDLQYLKDIDMVKGMETTVKGNKYIDECINLFKTYEI